MKPTVTLTRAAWSNNFSQILTGYDDSGQWVETETVWWRREDLYEGDGSFYAVDTWARSGADYGSRERSE